MESKPRGYSNRIMTGVSLTLILGLAVVSFPAAGAASHAAGDAAATYATKCAACHAKDGSGDTPAGKGMKVRDLRSGDVQGQADAQLIAVIGKGKGKMPAYEKTLGADAVKGLAAYVRTLKR
jgi:cytochrome c6